MAIVIVPTIAWAATLDPGHHSFSKWAIADFFVRFTTLSEQKVSLQEEKSNVSSRIDQSKMISVSDPLFMICGASKRVFFRRYSPCSFSRCWKAKLDQIRK